MQRLKKFLKDKPISASFYGLLLLSMIYTLIIWFIRRNQSPLSAILFHDKGDTFMDFFNCIHHVSDMDPYGLEIKGSYPALAYSIFAFFSRFIPSAIVDRKGQVIRASQYGMTVFTVFMVVSIAVMAYIFYKNLKGTEVERVGFTILIFFTAPFLFWVERGNIISIALIFMAIFVFYKDSPNKVLREIALISLAISACIKIYPAILGIVLIKDKRWKEAIRCIIYGILIFVVPFFLFGGLGSILEMVKYIFKASGEFDSVGYGYKVNISNTLLMMTELLGIKNHTLTAIIGKIPYILVILGLFAIFKLEKKWKQIALLTALLVAVPNFSNIYTLIMMTVPLIMFLNDADKHSKMDWLYMLCFAGMYMLMIRGATNFFANRLDTSYPVYLGEFCESWAILGMIVLLMIESLRNAVISFRNSSKRRKENANQII